MTKIRFNNTKLTKSVGTASLSDLLPPPVTLFKTLDNPNVYGSTSGDLFANSVNIADGYAICGAMYEGDSGGTLSGAAYIFDVATGNLLHTLTNPNAYSTSAGDSFGFAVDINGTYAAVSAKNEDVGGTQSGTVYVYNTVTGSLVYTIHNPNAFSTALADEFGYSVSISGNYLVVGAPSEDDGALGVGDNSGKVYVFDLTTGNLSYTIDNPNIDSSKSKNKFGIKLNADDAHIIVSASYTDTSTKSGVVYIFDVTDGTLLHTIDNPNAYGTPFNDYFGGSNGESVSISGNYAVASTSEEDDAAGTNSGAAYIFDVNTGGLLHTLTNPNIYSTSTGDTFGYSCVTNGEYVFVGANGEDTPTDTNVGVIYMYDVVSGALLRTIQIPDINFKSFGVKMAIDGNYAVFAAYERAYIYEIGTL